MGQRRRQAADFVHLMGNRESLDIFGENVIVEILFFFKITVAATNFKTESMGLFKEAL